MTGKLDKALARLQRLLPLKQRQIECGDQIGRLHRAILRSFVTNGRMLTTEEMAQYTDDLNAALDMLRISGMVVFSDAGDPVGAYPFTTEVREHRVRVNGHQVHVMCALDALAVSPMFELNTQTESRCDMSGDPVSIRQSGTRIENPDEIGAVHLGIDWGAADSNSCCANSLCRQMIFLRDREAVRQWLADGSNEREFFTLPEAVEFARRFFVPLLSG